MSRKQKILVISLVVVAVTATVAVPAVARMGRSGRGIGGGMGRGTGVCPVFTEEQREQIEQVHEKHGDRRAELANRASVLRLEMRDFVAAEGEPDFDAIERKMEEMAEVKLDLMKLRLRIHQEVRPLLTEDQKKLFDAGVGRLLEHGRGAAGGLGMGPCIDGMGPRMRGGMMGRGGTGQGMGAGPGAGPGMMMRRPMQGQRTPMPLEGVEDDD